MNRESLCTLGVPAPPLSLLHPLIVSLFLAPATAWHMSPPLVVCLESLETHIHMLWGAHFVTLSFAQPTPEEKKVLAFARDIRLGLLPDTVVVQPEWLIPADVAVPQEAEMKDLLARLSPGHPLLLQDTA